MARMSDRRGRTAGKAKKIDVESQIEHKPSKASIATVLDAWPDAQGFAIIPVTNGGAMDVHMSGHAQSYIDRPALEMARSTYHGVHETAVPSALVKHNPTVSNTDAMAVVIENQVTRVDCENAPIGASMIKRTGQRPIKRGRPSKVSQPRLESAAAFEALEDAPVDPIDYEPMPNTGQYQGFWMNEEEKVKAFLRDHIEKIHQLSDKKIAKAWIKGICPKKQANFPYQNKQRQKDLGKPPVVPKWWPSVGVCAFIEPDHVTRGPRNDLLLHLLRLRPSPKQLKTWNNEKCEPHPTHAKIGWTAFLRELAPVDSLDEIPPTTGERVGYRRRLLQDVYHVAEMEEDYKRFGIDMQYQYSDSDKPTSSKSSKRARREASEATTGEDAPYICSRSASPSLSSRAPSKRPRRDSVCSDAKPSTVRNNIASHMSTFAITEETMAQTDKLRAQTYQADIAMEAPSAHVPVSTAQHPKPDQKPAVSDVKRQRRSHPTTADWRAARRDAVEQQQQQQQQHQAAMQQQWQTNQTSATTSFDSSMSGAGQTFDTYECHMGGQSMFPGNHNYAFPQAQYHHRPQPQPQQMVRVYQAAQLSEPQFDTVPNTPTFSPASLIYPQNIHQFRQYDMAAVADSLPASQPLMPAQQEAFHFPPGFVDHSLVQHNVTPYHHQQAYAMQHSEPQQGMGHVLPLQYTPQVSQMQYGGLPLNYAELQ
ncbi:hypothetical protein LTR85_007039 [Meristemomyces frigidus]|nr:hypothetical protein LTR85_007039 [Meristemomyces frigidus]